MTSEKKPPITDKAYLKALFSILNRYFARPINSKGELIELYHKCTNKKNFVNATRNLIHYLVDRELMDEGVAIKLLNSDFLKAVQTGVREIYLTDKEIVDGLRLIENKWDRHTLMLYRFLIYTGVRLKPAVEALTNFDKSKLELNGSVAVYPMTEYSKGKKKNFIAVMPKEFALTLNQLPNYSITTWRSRLNPKKWKPPIKSRIEPSTIRKWCDNFFVLHNIPESISDFVQGRSNITVGTKHYLHKRMQAIEHYKKVIDKFPI